jgi:WD40 repeat protein
VKIHKVCINISQTSGILHTLSILSKIIIIFTAILRLPSSIVNYSNMTDLQLTSNPFPGIRSYEPHEEHLFFGRDQQIKELISRLSSTHFLAITGASGCGKSSLIKAGLMPSLVKKKAAKDPHNWEVSIFRPGDDPIGSMAAALHETYLRTGPDQKTVQDQTDLENVLRSGKDGVIQALKLQNEASDKNNLIIIDQFEELFRFKGSLTSYHNVVEASHFIDLILTALEQDAIPVYVIISMRSDFIDECTEYTGLTEKINQGHYLVPRMSKDEIRSAITEPVRVCGASITDNLVNRLLEEAGSDPDQLPVLQHALMRTWEHWQQNPGIQKVIDEHHYEAIGTMSEALSVHAEEVYSELPDQKHQDIAEKLFKALTDVGEDNKGTRRPTLMSEICSIAGAKAEEVITVINHFRQPGRTFLMPPYEMPLNEDTVIDITHESIMRIWHRLHQWVEEETQSAQLYMRLSKSAELFQEGKTGLWIDPELHLAINWMENNTPNQAWASRYDPAFDRAINFLRYSKKEADLEIAKKEERQRRELVRARRFAIILGAASIISIFFLIISLNLMFKAEASEKKALEKEKLAQVESRIAEEQRQESVIQRKISEQQQQIAEQQKLITEKQKQYAIQQQNIAIQERKEAVHQRQVAETAENEAVVARDEADAQRKVAIEQKQIADSERIKAETSEHNARRLRLIAVAKTIAIKSTELQSSGKSDLPALLALQAYKWNLENEGLTNDPDIFKALSSVAGTPLILRVHKDEVRAIDIGNDGHNLASGSLDGTVKLWNMDNPDQPPRDMNTRSYGQNGFCSLSFSHDARLLAAGTYNGEILLWDMSDPDSEPRILQGHTSIVTQLSFDKSDGTLVSGSADGSVTLWDIRKDPVTFRYIEQSTSRITSVCFTPDGSSVAWGNEKGEVKLSNLRSMMAAPVLVQSTGRAVFSLDFSPDGNVLATGDEDGLIRLWQSDNPFPQAAELIGHISRVTALRFSPDGQILASCSFDGTIRLWDFKNTEAQPIIIDDQDFWISGIAFTPDGNRLACCSPDKSIRIRIVNPSMLAGKICGIVSRNLTTEEWNKYIGVDINYVKTCTGKP